METIFKKTIVWHLLILALPFIYLGIAWNNLPDPVPMHYSNGAVDRFGSRTEFLIAIAFLFVIGLGLSWLFRNISRFDPKNKLKDSGSLVKTLALVLVLFLSSLSLYIIYTTANYSPQANIANHEKMGIALVSILFIVLGNLMNNIKPNYFFGIRTPWALENEDNWRKTHHLGAKIWFFGGILMLITSLVFPVSWSENIIFIIIIPMALIPIIYSYLIFKRGKKNISQ